MEALPITDLYPLLNAPNRRGELNNNPCNIDKGTPPIPWLGLAPVYMQRKDARFAIFISPDYGFRAAAIDMRTHAARTTPFTLAAAVAIWAPPNENDTKAYIANVAAWTKFNPDTVIDTHNMPIMITLLTAICREEQGRCIYPGALIQHGMELAGGWTTLMPGVKT